MAPTGPARHRSLQRDPHTEEPEPPLVEAGMPDRRHRVSPVVEWRWRRPPRRRKWSTPSRRRRGTPAPRRDSLAPRGTMPLPPEVSSALPRRLAPVVVRPVVVGWRSTGSALLVLRRRSTGSALLVLWRRPTRSTTTDLRRGPAVTRLTGNGRWRCGCGACGARSHTGGGYAECGGDGCPRHQLLHLQVHRATPVL